MMHNPNHAGQPPPQTHTTFYQPPTSQQPPVQIPFSDPFLPRRADPFLPNTQTQRRESYGIHSGRDGGGSAPHSERPQTGNMWQNASGTLNFAFNNWGILEKTTRLAVIGLKTYWVPSHEMLGP